MEAGYSIPQRRGGNNTLLWERYPGNNFFWLQAEPAHYPHRALDSGDLNCPISRPGRAAPVPDICSGGETHPILTI